MTEDRRRFRDQTIEEFSDCPGVRRSGAGRRERRRGGGRARRQPVQHGRAALAGAASLADARDPARGGAWPPRRQHVHACSTLADEDAAAYATYRQARRMPTTSDEESAARDAATRQAARVSAEVPAGCRGRLPRPGRRGGAPRRTDEPARRQRPGRGRPAAGGFRTRCRSQRDRQPSRPSVTTTSHRTCDCAWKTICSRSRRQPPAIRDLVATGVQRPAGTAHEPSWGVPAAAPGCWTAGPWRTRCSRRPGRRSSSSTARRGSVPEIRVLLVGDDAASAVYARRILRSAEAVGSAGRLVTLRGDADAWRPCAPLSPT